MYDPLKDAHIPDDFIDGLAQTYAQHVGVYFALDGLFNLNDIAIIHCLTACHEIANVEFYRAFSVVPLVSYSADEVMNKIIEQGYSVNFLPEKILTDIKEDEFFRYVFISLFDKIFSKLKHYIQSAEEAVKTTEIFNHEPINIH